MIRTISAIINDEADQSIVAEIARAAYWYGQHVAAKRVCDKASIHMAGQSERAKKCRYFRMAQKIIANNRGYIYDSSYGDIEIGSWDFDV